MLCLIWTAAFLIKQIIALFHPVKLNIKRKSLLQKLQIAVLSSFLSLSLFNRPHSDMWRGACSRNERGRQTDRQTDERAKDRCSPLQSQFPGVKMKSVFKGIPFISSSLTFPLLLLLFSVNLHHLLLLFGLDGHLAAVCGLGGFVSHAFKLSYSWHKHNKRTKM